MGPAGQCIPEEKSTRTIQETSKKQGAESCGTEAQQASGRLEIPSRKVGSFPPAKVHVPQVTFHLQSRKTQRGEKGSFELEPQLCTSDCSSISTLSPKTQPLPRTTVSGNQGGPGEKMVSKGVTFHLGTLQPLEPLVWGKQLGLCQGGSPL